MEQGIEHLKHLERLAVELTRQGLAATLVRRSQPYVKVANLEIPAMNEKVLCAAAAGAGLCFWWPWRQPIGSVDELDAVVGKIVLVLRAVEDAR